MSHHAEVAGNLTSAFLGGAWTVESLRRRGVLAIGRKERWLGALCRRVLERFPVAPAIEQASLLTNFLLGDFPFARACARHVHLGQNLVARVYCLPSRMQPVQRPAATWQVPALPSPGALAEWLQLTPGQLDGFADQRGWEAAVAEGPLRNYDYRWVSGARGKRRLLEQPRRRIKALQRRILHEILERIPAHESAHGFRRQRSIVTYASPHVGKSLVLRLDLRDFFPSITARRVRAVFRTAGYPQEVSRLLAGLCTNVVPEEVWSQLGVGSTRERYRTPHLPQGAPTSPALANLCAHRLDRRLAGLARHVGASYTRYADDLAFSGDEEFERRARRFYLAVCRIVVEEGFEVNMRKTRFMRRAVRQQLTGVVVNDRVNYSRRQFEVLEAIVVNCVRHGPSSQNRDNIPDFRSHLAGRIGHVVHLNPRRGEKLRRWFEQIDWARSPRRGAERGVRFAALSSRSSRDTWGCTRSASRLTSRIASCFSWRCPVGGHPATILLTSSRCICRPWPVCGESITTHLPSGL